VKPGREPISDQTWEAIRAEFTLPSLGQVRRRLSELMEHPESVMQQLIRVLLTRAPSAQDSSSSTADSSTQPSETFSKGQWN
jgi:hypothetical protein